MKKEKIKYSLFQRPSNIGYRIIHSKKKKKYTHGQNGNHEFGEQRRIASLRSVSFASFPETSPNKTGVLQICSSCSHPEGEEKLEREAGARWIGRRVVERGWWWEHVADPMLRIDHIFLLLYYCVIFRSFAFVFYYPVAFAFLFIDFFSLFFFVSWVYIAQSGRGGSTSS